MKLGKGASFSLKKLIGEYKHALLFSYLLIYLVWFVWLEKRTGVIFFTVHTTLDEHIPFCEWFVIPYMMWFFFVAAVLIYTCLFDKGEYFRTSAFLYAGMTICLIIYTIWPNMQDLRPAVMPNDNPLTLFVFRHLYGCDTPTNVCPSIHVYNSIGCYIAIERTESLRKHPLIRFGGAVLTVAICLSTMFLKQHSVFDVFCAILLGLGMYLIVYVPDYSALFGEEPVHGHARVRKA